MTGGLGNDTYLVDNAGDTVFEKADEGIDTVRSSISYTLTGNVENLVLTGVSPINATGNALGNVLSGNTAGNILDGGAGADTMFGGLGDDTYVVDNTGDVTTEGPAAGGIDTVISSVSRTLGANLENLTLTGAATLGAGNTLANKIVGNDQNNNLSGGQGDDTLTGGVGNDVFNYAAFGLGHDTITDFQGGVGPDMINVHNVLPNFAAVLAAVSQQGPNTVITIDANNSIVLENFLASGLVVDDFKF